MVPNSSDFSKSGISKTIISKKQIEESGAVDLIDVLKSLPDINITQSGPTGQQASMFMRGSGSNHTLVMINGVPINDQSTTQGLHDFGVDFIQTIQQIEIYPGSSATQFGTKDLNYLDNFTCQITIHCFSEVGGRQGLKEVYNCTLQEAYPRTIQDLQLDWSANDVARLNVVFDYKYFRDESFNEIESSAKPRLGGFFSRSGLGAAAASLGGRAVSGLSPRTQQAIGGVVSGGLATRVASKLFF